MLNTPKEDFLFLGEEKELLPSLSRWMNWGGLLIVGTFGLTIILASVFKYNVIIQAPASIRPDGELRIVQAGIEGQVKQIFVKDNLLIHLVHKLQFYQIQEINYFQI